MNSYQALDDLYATLPKLNCAGFCKDSCGPIWMSGLEWIRISTRVGREPIMAERTLTCPLLDKETGRCTVYRIRPLVCHLWGMTEDMKCHYGCVPENGRYLTKAEGFEFMRKAQEISDGLGIKIPKCTSHRFVKAALDVAVSKKIWK